MATRTAKTATARQGRSLPTIQPVTNPQYAPSAANVSQAPTPAPAPVAEPVSIAPAGGRDYAREQKVMQELGFTPRTQEEQALMFRATYSPDELQKLGLDQEFQGLKGDYEAARSELMATPRPTNTGLRVLQDALNAKSNVTNQPIGESKMFEKVGLGGYETLRQSLSERSREMDDKYNSFKFTVSDVAGAMSDTYNVAADRYKLLKDEYDAVTSRANEVLDEINKHERALELLQKQHEFDKELINLRESFSGESGEAGEFVSDAPVATGGQFKNRLTGTGTITAYGSSAWKPGLDLAAAKGSPIFSPGKAIVRKIVTGHSSVGANNEAGLKQNGGFGNQVVLELADGNLMFISHLDAVNPALFVGKEVPVGEIVGNMGNTGYTMGKTGVHADITMKPNDGKYALSESDKGLWTAKQVAEYISGDLKTQRVPVKDLPLPEFFKPTLEKGVTAKQPSNLGSTVVATEPIDDMFLEALKNRIYNTLKLGEEENKKTKEKKIKAEIKKVLNSAKESATISPAIEVTDELVDSIYNQFEA